ncbi:unnamed protein product [Cuscuta epithymum]|uniref:Uncharacterized protein n=1 Tax=Cuscuta epithymum TaxID=186058 RepID=A0AAV0G443_9ASTE|nr:unnamed protein product [Cuscuta epithymum]
MADSDATLPFTTLVHMITIKLTSSNYLLWRNQVATLLESQGLFGYIDGSIPSPTVSVSPTPDEVKRLATWNTQDKRLVSLLLSSLMEESMAETLGCTTSAKIWKALASAFNLSSKSREIQLRDELQQLRRGSRSVTDYGKLFHIYCDKLAAIGSPVSSVDKIHWFCRGLGPSFTSFSLTQLKLDPLPALRDVISEAESHALFQKSLEEPAGASTVAFAAHSSPAPFRGQRPSRQPKQNSSHPHTSSSGPRFPSNSRCPRRPYVPRCQICKIDGHFANDCPERFVRTSSTPSANLAEAFNAVSLSSADSSDWYVDSGASSHMTADKSALDHTAPYTAQVHKGDRGSGSA